MIETCVRGQPDRGERWEAYPQTGSEAAFTSSSRVGTRILPTPALHPVLLEGGTTGDERGSPDAGCTR
jgi:hypothetical protein